MFKRFKEKKGAVAVMAAIVTVAVLGFSALAIDVGIVMTSRNQLQNAADSAALAAASKLGTDVIDEALVRSTAKEYASYNEVLNQPVVLQDNDIQIVDNPDMALRSVRVTAYHTVNLLFAKFLGWNPVNVNMSSMWNPVNFLFFGSALGYSSVEISTSSKSGLIPINATDGIRPWAIRDKCLGGGNDNDNSDDNSNDNSDDNSNDNSDDNSNDNSDDNSNDNSDDNSNDNSDDNSNDDSDDNSNDNSDDNSNDNSDDNSNDNSDDNSNDNSDDNSNDNSDDNSNDNSDDNSNDNSDDNSNDDSDDNSNDNSDDNSNDNSDDNSNDNSDDNSNDNSDDNSNDNSDDNSNDNSDDNSNDNSDDNSNDNSDDNGTPCTGYEYPEVGELVTLKFGPQDDREEPHWFAPVDMPPVNKGTPQTGADAYRNLIENGSQPVGNWDGTVAIGDTVRIEPGNMAGPTEQGVNYVINLDSTAYWDTNTNQVIGSSYPDNKSPRIIKIIFYDPNVGVVGSPGEITVTRIGAFFLEGATGPPDSNVTGRFIENVISGDLDVNAQSRVFGVGLLE